MSYYLLASPFSRDIYRLAVCSYVIILRWHFWWHLIEMPTPSEAHIHVFRITIAVQFPDTRNRHCLPL